MKWTFEAGKRYIFSSPISVEDYLRAEFMSKTPHKDLSVCHDGSYMDEYDWFVKTCEELDIEPECFDD